MEQKPKSAEIDRAMRPSGSALTSDSAGTATRHLDLVIKRLITAVPPAAEPLVAPETTIVAADTVRETTRRAAIEQEIRMMTGNPEIGLPAVMEAADSDGRQISQATLDRIQRDARFRLPRRQIQKLLDRFCGDVVGNQPKAAPRTLAIVAHPDDESIGMGGQLSRLKDPIIVHVTDGAPRDPEYSRRMGFDHPADYAAARRNEAREALRLVGVPEDHMICLEIPDGEVQHRMVDLCYSIAELIENIKPDVIVTHPYEGGHTDHDAISFAVQLACGVLRREGLPEPAVLEFTSYHHRGGERVVSDFLPFGIRDDVRTLALPEQMQEVKRQMYECFETQRECLTQFQTGLERFRPAPRYNYTKAPHEGTLEYERLSRRLSGEYWRSQAFAALERLRTDSKRSSTR